jgi:hypothetical protein
MWALIPAWVKRAVVSLVTGAALLWAAWFAGKREGGQRADTERHEGNAKSAQKAKEARYEMEISDDQRLVDILTGKLHDRKR